MGLKVTKRDGRIIKFDNSKIENAIKKANKNEKYNLKKEQIKKITKSIVKIIKEKKKDNITIEEIQDIVVSTLKKKHPVLSKKYQDYRIERSRVRENKLGIMKSIEKIGVQTDRDNANVGNNFSAKLLRIASESNKWHLLNSMIPQEFSLAHKNGDFYIHDLDSYNLTINCLHIPTKKMLASGFNTGYGMTNPPKRISTAVSLCCILLQSSQNDMFGGQSLPNIDNDLAPYIRMTREEIKKNLKALGVPAAKLKVSVEKELIKQVKQAAQALIYNLNTMHSRAGAQVPFSSINIGIPQSDEAAMFCQAVLEEYNKGMGNGEQPIFPNIIFRVKDGVNKKEGDPYYYLFQIACAVAAVRMNPTFMNIDADFNKEWYDKGIIPSTMGCRTYVMSNINGEPGTEGRGNIAPITLNIVRLGIDSSLEEKDQNKRIELFFKKLDDLLEKSMNQLLHRYSVLKKLKVKDIPFTAGQHLYVSSDDLNYNDSIEPLLKQGTWGLGYIGLAETLKMLTGKHHGESEESQELGLKIIGKIREKCEEFKNRYKLNVTCYATPAEGLSNKFTIADEKNMV